MTYRAILAFILVSMVCTSTSVLARGGGSGGHGGFAGRGTSVVTVGRSSAGFQASRPVSVLSAGRAGGLSQPSLSNRFLSPIRPEVIAVSPGFGAGVINPPFTGPVVPSFGAVIGGLPFGRLPVVVTPFSGVPFFGYPVPTGPGGVPDQTQTQAAPVPGGTEPAGPNATLAACHAVPSGYHCDWPS